MKHINPKAGFIRQTHTNRESGMNRQAWRQALRLGLAGFGMKTDQAKPGSLIALWDYRTQVAAAGFALGLADKEDAIVYVNDAHAICLYSELCVSAQTLRPSQCIYTCNVGPLGVEKSHLRPMPAPPNLDLSMGLPQDALHPWGVSLTSAEADNDPIWMLMRFKDFETLFARMRVKPERALPFPDRDLVAQVFRGLKDGAGVELASAAKTAEEVIRSLPFLLRPPGETQ